MTTADRNSHCWNRAISGESGRPAQSETRRYARLARRNAPRGRIGAADGDPDRYCDCAGARRQAGAGNGGGIAGREGLNAAAQGAREQAAAEKSAAKKAAILQAKADKLAAAEAEAAASVVPVASEEELKAARDAKYAARKRRKG